MNTKPLDFDEIIYRHEAKRLVKDRIELHLCVGCGSPESLHELQEDDSAYCLCDDCLDA